jgi:hypothetical protein
MKLNKELLTKSMIAITIEWHQTTRNTALALRNKELLAKP